MNNFDLHDSGVVLLFSNDLGAAEAFGRHACLLLGLDLDPWPRVPLYAGGMLGSMYCLSLSLAGCLKQCLS